MNERIYICGKVSGRPIHEVTMQFGAAEQKLRALGYNVVNPLTVVNDWHLPWNKAMRLCVAALMRCDALYALPNAAASRGAMIEIEIAEKLGIRIITEK